MKSISAAIMQPYWIPYLGYFRLFEAADYFIFLDNVQFPRRGYVHRNKLLKENKAEEWITLPLKKTVRSALIKELEFQDQWWELLMNQTKKFPALRLGFGAIEDEMTRPGISVVDMLQQTLLKFKQKLGLSCECVSASSLGEIKKRGEDKILELVRRIGATTYVNASGGAQLYDSKKFSSAGVELKILKPWIGSSFSILEELSNSGEFGLLRQKIIAQTHFS